MVNVVMVASENDALPGSKVGGIGDVLRDVPSTLAANNVGVDVIVPSHGFLHRHPKAELITQLKVNFRGKNQQLAVYKIMLGQHNISQWVLDHPSFDIDEQVYIDDGAKRPFASDANKFALFGLAVAQLVIDHLIDKADVLHLHDWHAAFIAILRAYDPQFQALQRLKCVYSIHNIALQGIRPFKGDESALKTWYPRLELPVDAVIDPRYSDCINLARAGINLADVVHTVSPTYAEEVLLPSAPERGFFGGEGLEKDLAKRKEQGCLFGILNGCDYQEDDEPATESEFCKLTALENFLTYSQQVLWQWVAQKPTIRSSHYLALERLKQLTAANFSGPIVTSVGRLTDQKALIAMQPLPGSSNREIALDAVLKEIAKDNGLMIVIGSGDAAIEQALTQCMVRQPNFLFLNGYSQVLSDQAYDLGELFFMPSSFEPCGISQMLALRSGQPCVVHAIGGLKDTVKHMETGFCFEGNSLQQQAQAMVNVFEQALATYKDKTYWPYMQEQALKQRFDWQSNIEKYLSQLYALN